METIVELTDTHKVPAATLWAYIYYPKPTCHIFIVARTLLHTCHVFRPSKVYANLEDYNGQAWPSILDLVTIGTS